MSDFKFSNKQIADGFECNQGNIRKHKSKHKDDLIKNIDYVSDVKLNYKTYWSESGVIKLADFINTKQAKKFIGTLEVKKEILEKQQTKEIVPATSPQPIHKLPDNQLFGLMDMMLASMKRQAEKVGELETRIEEVASQKALVSSIQIKTFKDYKSAKEDQLNDIGREINALIFEHFITKEHFGHKLQEEKSMILQNAHREARRLYYELTGITYIGAKKASFESKKQFLDWLKKVKV